MTEDDRPTGSLDPKRSETRSRGKGVRPAEGGEPGQRTPSSSPRKYPDTLQPSEVPTASVPDDAWGAGRLFSPGQILGGRYRVIALLGRGGMGEVWRAFDLKLRVEVALKCVLGERVKNERSLELLRREVRSAREVVSPNVCRVYDLVEIDGHELISMEYIDGVTLLEMLGERGPLTLRQAQEIASQILSGLEAIHEAGLVHRDVKPENVMITRAGRVVLMDFGLAKPEVQDRAGTVSGTPAYMAPEQMRGDLVDARADLFAAGIVLAEMVSGEAVRDRPSRESLWHGVHQDPPQVPETPWRPVLLKAVSKDREGRYASARALTRALEDVTLRVEGAEDLRPYPGLASFTEADAEYFFGREAEVEQMWLKLQQPHLQALIGPSGAGKSSFLRAGLIPALPGGWRCVVCTPGSSPLLALARAIVPELSGDTEAIRRLLEVDDQVAMVSVVGSWRRRHEQVLLVVDQFEELFTLNPSEVQKRFADLLGRLAVEADVHVLLSMRDDFLFHCSHQPALKPVFSELTPLPPLNEADLRRALVQPALKCGYRFEQDALVDQMVREVGLERGALPLAAFALAQLWERRDRESGLLTRKAYEEIGGVGGALAQHAEWTLERIGSERQPIVREIFRNLVTAQGTRAMREKEDLLSVFEDRHSADVVLRELIDARLLTSFEAEVCEGSERRQQLEIVHESLLSAWPRLVRWQTQDADSAQLRDQLRQASQLWLERGRPPDLLWSGVSYREFRLWRERYPGGLTGTEAAFADAMVTRAERHRRRRRLMITAAFSTLLAVVGVIGWYAYRERLARLGADASRLFAFAQLEIEKDPTDALALSIASLERADSAEVRRFALEALWRGPTYFSFHRQQVGNVSSPGIDFSPDGRWLAVGDLHTGKINLFDFRGGAPRVLTGAGTHVQFVRFGPGSDVLLTGAQGSNEVQIWSVDEGRLIRSVSHGPIEHWHEPLFMSEDRSRMITGSYPQGLATSLLRVLLWEKDGNAPVVMGELEDIAMGFAVDPRGTLIAYGKDGGIYTSRLDALGRSPPRFVGKHADPTHLAFDATGILLASGEFSGGIRVWSLESKAGNPLLVAETSEGISSLGFDRAGRRLASGHSGGITRIWDLEGPPDVSPMSLHGREDIAWGLVFHPQGRWLATTHRNYSATLWPLGGRRHRILFRKGSGGAYTHGIAFAPDGDWIAATMEEETLRRWPLGRSGGSFGEVPLGIRGIALAVDSGGRNLLVGGGAGVALVSLRDGRTRKLQGFEQALVISVALSNDGRLAAAGGNFAAPETAHHFLRVWDLEQGTQRDLHTEQEIDHLSFLPDGQVLYVSGPHTGSKDLYRWNLQDEDGAELLKEGITDRIWPMCDLDRDGRRLLVGTGRGVVLHDLEDGSTGEIPADVESCIFGPDETLLVCTHEEIIRVVPLGGGAHYDLVGHEGYVNEVAVSPDGTLIASLAWDGTLRLWPMPQGEPLSSLPLGQFLDRLRTFTNHRAVLDEESDAGWSTVRDPAYPGWESVPTW